MSQKKRLFCFIIPAVVFYVTAIGFITAGSVTKTSTTKSIARKTTQKPAEDLAKALEQELVIQKNETNNDFESLEIIPESQLALLRKNETTVDTAKESAIGFEAAIFSDSSNSTSKNDLATAKETISANADKNANGSITEAEKQAVNDAISEQGEMLNGMGGADVTPQPEMGIEMPELYYTVYRIQEGDMIGVLAETYGVTQDTLISVNNIKQSRSIMPGQYLCIPSMPGIVYTTREENETPETIAEKYKVSAAKVAHLNNMEATSAFPVGTTLFVPDAELDWVTRQEINGDLFTRPLRRGYYISSSYSWRVNPFTGRRTFHNGIDMAAPKGTPVYAALSGVVVAAGWDNIYGNYVTVSHHSGYKTLYGHLSKITTKRGASVSTNTKIGEVGSTGQSTGPHLHFTIFKNGGTINPASLWN